MTIRFAALASLAFVLALPALAEDKKAVPKELEPFQGEWKLVKAELNGKAVDEKLQLTFKGEKAEALFDEKEKDAGSITVDAKKSPTEIDLFTEKGDKSLGIFKFEDNGAKLVICFVRGNEKRPTKFDSSELPGATLLTFEKVKR